MPMSEEERKERKRIRDKIRYKDNREKMLNQSKEWYDANKEKIKQQKKQYHIDNKDYIKEYQQEYRQTETGKKKITISVWKNDSKIKFKDKQEAEFYYNTYINTHRCTWCDIDFKDSKDRCLDHCHTCGLPRAIICRNCNFKDEVPCVNCLL